MIIFLYGQDSYRSKKKLDELINHYKESNKSGLNLIYIDTKDVDFDEFYNNFKISSMFGEKKLVILNNLFSHKKFQEDFLENITTTELLKDVVVVYEKESVDERTKLFKTLKKGYKSQEFNLLDAKGLRLFAENEFKSRGAKINIDALSLLLSYVGNDLWKLSNEIDKLANFKPDAAIKKEDIQLQVRPRIEVDIFQTIDSLASKNKKMAFLLLKKHLSNGDSPIYLFSMLQYQFRNLLAIKELAEKGLMYDSIVKKSGLHPFVVKKNYFQCKNFSMQDLKNIYKKIFQIDLQVKSGKIDAETALDMLVNNIS